MDTGSNVGSTSISDYNEENWPWVDGIEAKSAFVQAGGPEDYGKNRFGVCASVSSALGYERPAQKHGIYGAHSQPG